jgi:hypothetical protein
MIWFGRLSAISKLASREGGRGGVGQNPLHIITLPGPGREAGRWGSVPSPWSTPRLKLRCPLHPTAKLSREKKATCNLRLFPLHFSLVLTVGPVASSVWFSLDLNDEPNCTWMQGTVYSNLVVCNFITQIFNSASRYPLCRPQSREGERGNRGNSEYLC